MEEVDREISEMKLSLNARARIVAESYLTAVGPQSQLRISMLTSTSCDFARSSIHDISRELRNFLS